MNIWDEANLKAIGSKKSSKKYTITVNTPIVVTTDNQEKYFSFRSVLIQNNIQFTVSETEEICKNWKIIYYIMKKLIIDNW